MTTNLATSSKGRNGMITELTPADYELMHQTKEYWVDRALIGGSGNLTVEDIRDDINWLYKTVGDMKTDKPNIFFFKSYATYQLGFNLLKIISEDETLKFNTNRKNFLEHPSMDRVWDLLWFGKEGKSIHESLDSNIKRELQEVIWETIARSAGDGVGMGVWDVIRQNLNKSVTDMVWMNLWKKVAIPGAQEILSRVTENVWNDVLQQIADYIGNSINVGVNSQLQDSIKKMLSKKSEHLLFVDHFIGAGNWSGWIAFYDFFVRAGIIGKDNGLPEEWVTFRRLLDKGIWTMSLYDDCVLVCTLPTRVRRDEVTKQLHSLQGPAIEWSDGTGQYFIHGLNFSESFIDNLGSPPELWDRIANGKITWDEIFGLRNIEQRRVAVRVYGPKRILQDAKAVLIDTSGRGNKLYKITPQIATRDPKTGKVTFKADDRRQNTDENHTRIPEMRAMHYRDPSTDREYYSFVPTNINKADDGMSWKFQLTPAQYNRLKVEA